MLKLFLGITLILLTGSAQGIIRDTLTQFEPTQREIENIFRPTAYTPLMGDRQPTKPAMYFKLADCAAQIVEVYAYFLGTQNWRSNEVPVFLCEGTNNTGPQEDKIMGNPVSITAPDRHSTPGIADFIDQDIILDANKGFFVVFEVNENDGSPWLLVENLNYSVGDRSFTESGFGWCILIIQNTGWIKMNTTPWVRQLGMGDWSIHCVVDYQCDVNTTPASWQEIKLNQ